MFKLGALLTSSVSDHKQKRQRIAVLLLSNSTIFSRVLVSSAQCCMCWPAIAMMSQNVPLAHHYAIPRFEGCLALNFEGQEEPWQQHLKSRFKMDSVGLCELQRLTRHCLSATVAFFLPPWSMSLPLDSGLSKQKVCAAAVCMYMFVYM